jgi:HK97 gp10 family phage protein
MELEIHIEGTEEMAAELRGLASDVQTKFLIQALKAGGSVVRDYSQAEAPTGKTAQLATSMTVSTRGEVVLVGPNKEPRNDPGDKRHMRNDSVCIFNEGGTKNHFTWTGQRITAAEARRKKKNVISFQKTEERMPARPFLALALEHAAQPALQAEADKLSELIAKRQARLGE